MNSKHSHCTTITKTPAVAQTALQVKLQFVDDLYTTATNMVTAFATNIAAVKSAS